MKSIKIILSIVILASIILFIYRGCNNPPPPPPPPTPASDWISKIKAETNNNLKSIEEYSRINNLITNCYQSQLFSKNIDQNKQWRDILAKNLFSAFTKKLISNTNIYFKKSIWDPIVLSKINETVKNLKNSPYLIVGSVYSKELNQITNTLNKFTEISNFIISCKNINPNTFELDDAQSKLYIYKRYLANNMEDPKVNNCSSIKTELNSVPTILFNKHVAFLNNKITESLGKYKDYRKLIDYKTYVWIPLSEEIDDLQNNMYGIPFSVLSYNYNQLSKKWEDESEKAYLYP